VNLLVGLYEPQIPQNTGNIGRLCVGFDCELSLIGKLGFEITDAKVKRAGLDYWPDLRYEMISEFETWMKTKVGSRPLVAFSKRGTKLLYEHEFHKDSVVLFGKETTGIPEEILEAYKIPLLALPMIGPIRSYNLANSVGMVLSEAYRQLYFLPTRTVK
jgi:tRNA (cytidine/uridine-2'-O-)-methyltransferase